MALAQHWTSHFTSLERSRWPGPRPLRQADVSDTDGNRVPDGPLQGRTDDADTFFNAVLDHLMVVLAAESGVGKSSLINTRLIPQLKSSGYSVEQEHSWTRDATKSVADRLDDLVQKLPAIRPGADGVTDTRVLVLDQFEELIRYSATDARQAYEWLERTNQRETLRVVISLRAEYLHHLRNVERRARPFSFAMIQLEPIVNAETVEQIVTSRRAGTPAGLAELGRHFASDVSLLCADQGDQSIGLIDLQALLWELDLRHQSDNRQCQAPHHSTGDSRIEKSCLDDLQSAGDGSIFVTAVRLAVARKLRHCVESSKHAGYDSVVSDGALALSYEFMPKLASGDFKVQVDEFSAARHLLAREISYAGLSDQELRKLFELAVIHVGHTVQWPDDVAQFDLGSPAELGSREELRIRHRDQIDYTDWATWRTDVRFLSSGVMFGMHPVAVLYQRLRQFCLAMAWLEASDLVRVTRSGPGETKVALIHDRLASAVEELGELWSPPFSVVRSRVSSTRGEDLIWSGPDEVAANSRHRQALPVVANEVATNARWQDCTVKGARLQNVMLVNCDLRGSRFDHCTFEGVTFVNCLLDNVTFEACTVRGALDKGTPERSPSQPPAFRVKDPRSPDLLQRYRRPPGFKFGRGWREATTRLYSRTSGVAAVPVAAYEDTPIITIQSGGLAIHGGRLGSLMFVATVFDPGEADRAAPALGLFDITGASLDIVEQRGGSIRVLRSLIRGLTVSSAPGGKAQPALSLAVEESVITNTWIGSGVTGSAKLTESVAVQLVNLNSVDDFRIENLTEDEPTGAFTDESQLSAELEKFANFKGGWRNVVSEFSSMDFRIAPAQVELDPDWLGEEGRQQRHP